MPRGRSAQTAIDHEGDVMSDRSLDIKVSRNRGDVLHSFQPNANTKRRLVIAGEWSQSPFDQSFVEYYLAPADEEGTWVLEAVYLGCEEPDDDTALPQECADRDVDEITLRAGPNPAGLAFPVDSAYVVG